MTSSNDVTAALHRWRRGDDAAFDELMSLVYPELRRIAARHMRGERANHSLQPTALVNEVCLRLLDEHNIAWQNRVHFLGIAARLSRRVLVDHARRRRAHKRGLGLVAVQIDEIEVGAPPPDVDVIALDEALSRLALLNERQSQIVELRFFGGLTVDEAAAAMELSSGTVKRDWECARLWLYSQIYPVAPPSQPDKP